MAPNAPMALLLAHLICWLLLLQPVFLSLGELPQLLQVFPNTPFLAWLCNSPKHSLPYTPFLHCKVGDYCGAHMVPGCPFGLASLWEGEISVCIPVTSNKQCPGSVGNEEPKGQPVMLFCLVWFWLGALPSCHSPDVGAWRGSSPYRVGLGDTVPAQPR